MNFSKWLLVLSYCFPFKFLIIILLVAYKYKLHLRESNKKLFIQEKNCSSVAKDCGGMDSQYVQFKDAQCVINKFVDGQ